MHETPDELATLQRLLDDSAASGGPHLSDIISAERRLTAAQVCERLAGMRLLSVATVTADDRPLCGAVDGYLLHGFWYFSSGHGHAELFEFSDPVHGAVLRQPMLDHYLPLQGPSFEEWMDSSDEAMGARIVATKMFTFHLEGDT